MKKILVFAVSMILLSFSSKAGNIDLNKALPVDPSIKIGKMENGMYYFIKKNAKPENRAHFRLVIKTGAVDEDKDQDGLAHFCEHMAFNGTKNFPKNELINSLQRTGIKFGADLNASTGKEVTMYELPIPLDNEALLKDAFKILEDWAANVSYDSDQIDGERGVIMAEWRQRNNPSMRAMLENNKTIYYNSKYGTTSIIGDTAILQNFKHDVIRRYYKEWYRPNLMAIIAVGDFEPAKMEKMILEHFAHLKNPDNIRPKQKFDIPMHKEVLATVASDKELTTELSGVVFKLPKANSQTIGGLKSEIQDAIFSIIMQQRFAEIAKKANSPFLQAGAFARNAEGGIKEMRSLAVNKPGEGKKGFEAVMDEVVRVYKHGITQSELDRAKTMILAEEEKLYNEKNTRSSDRFVDDITEYFTDNDALIDIENEYKIVNEITKELSLDEINKSIKNMIAQENCVIFANLVDNGKQLAKADEYKSIFTSAFNKNVDAYKDVASNAVLFDKKPVAGKITKETKLDKIDAIEYTLSNGAKVIAKKTNFKDDEIIFGSTSQGGFSLYDKQDLISASDADNIISYCGIDKYDAVSFSKMLAGKKAGLSPYINYINEGMYGGSSKKDLEVLMQLIHLYHQYPRKNNEDFTNFIEKNKGMIASRSNNPDEIFRDSIKAIQNAYHPVFMPNTIEKLSKYKLDNAMQVYKERFANAGDFTYVFVGDFEYNDLKTLLEKYVASLPSQQTKEKWNDLGIRKPAKAKKCSIVKGNQDRSHVRLIINGDFAYNTKNVYELQSAVEMLELKVLESIREDKGGVYSPNVAVVMEKYPSASYSINIDFVTQPERVQEMISTVKSVMEDIKKNEDKDAAMKVKKAQEKDKDVTLKDNNFWFGSILESLNNQESPSDLLKYFEYVNTLDAKTIKNTAKKYFNTNNMIEVITKPETTGKN